MPLSITTTEATNLLRSALAPYTSHPSFAGFSLYDEPSPAKFASLANAVTIFRQLAPDKLPHINLYPSTDPSYPTSFASTVRPSLISYDRYPLLTSGDDTSYFVNFANVRTVALANDIPAWTYIQSVGYNGHRTTPDPARGEGYQPALITLMASGPRATTRRRTSTPRGWHQWVRRSSRWYPIRSSTPTTPHFPLVQRHSARTTTSRP